MKQLFYGQIDLTKLGIIARQHPELVKEVNFKDGTHKLINVAILDNEREDRFGNTACLRASCKREFEKEGINYFLGELKPSTPKEQPAQQSKPTAQPFPINNPDDLPF